MTIAMQPIYTQTVGAGGVTSITFNNIPQTFTDLKLVISARDDRLADSDFWKLRFNGDSATNYSQTSIAANAGGAAVSGRDTNGTSTNGVGLNAANATSNTFSNQEIYIPNYTGSNYKSTIADSVSENNAAISGTTVMGFNAGLWRSTAAITSLTFLVGVGPNFVQYSTFTLYGITKG